MRISLCFFFIALLFHPSDGHSEVLKPAARHLFYFHGKIVEDQGPEAKNEKFGEYQYYEIVKTFKDAGFVVHSDVRKKNTDIEKYARQQARSITNLIRAGVAPARITLIGASKGAHIAMAVQQNLQNSSINTVLLAGMFASVVNDPELQLFGKVLSIYDKSDAWLVAPTPLIERSKKLVEFKEIVVEMDLAHGLLFKPYPEWVQPALAWASRQPEE